MLEEALMRCTGFSVFVALALAACGGGSSSSHEPEAASLSGEYWVRGEGLKTPLHLRMLDSTRAEFFDATFTFLPQSFHVVASGAPLGSEPSPSNDPSRDGTGSDGPPLTLKGTWVLQNDSPPDPGYPGIAQIALSADARGQVASDALVLVGDGTEECLQGRVITWSAVKASAEPDLDETDLNVTPRETTPRGAIPWHDVWVATAKPTARPLLVDAVAKAPGLDSLRLLPIESYVPAQSQTFKFADWLQLVGQTVTLSTQIANTNGAGEPPGFSAQTNEISMLDFGPARTASLDFTAAVPDDLVTFNAQVLSNDPACLEPPATGSCLRVDSGGGIAMHFKGPILGIDVRARSDDAERELEVDAIGSDGTVLPYNPPRFDHPQDELFVVVRAPETYNRQTDPACATSVDWSYYVQGIDVVRP